MMGMYLEAYVGSSRLSDRPVDSPATTPLGGNCIGAQLADWFSTLLSSSLTAALPCPGASTQLEGRTRPAEGR